MAFHFNDNVYTHTFTPREYQVELLDAAKKKNTIICTNTSAAKVFIAVKVLQEYSRYIRNHEKCSVFILDPQNVHIMTSHIKLLTDLSATSVTDYPEMSWSNLIQTYSVLLTTTQIFKDCLEEISLFEFNLIVLDDCVSCTQQEFLSELMKHYRKLKSDKPRILGLAPGLLGPELKPICLEAELRRIEQLLCCSVDTSSELVTLLRLCCRPKERIVECECSLKRDAATEAIEDLIGRAKCFLTDHRYDPGEIYDEEFVEELRYVCDPKTQPLMLLDDVSRVLRELGPWAADQAALYFLCYIEKLKIRVPYERHYLLLCMVSTVMVAIRAICDGVFDDMDDLMKIRKYSSPKLLRFIEVLGEFKPSGEKPKLELVENVNNSIGKIQKVKGMRQKKNFHARQLSEETLCALIFTEKPSTAKVLYSLLCILNQQDEEFWWMSASYCIDKIADPTKEPREAENEHRKQEEVLRRYRTHECNIMVATSVLEQGCDLPKCNLVVRFDLPLSFHSYVQSKARARTADAYYVLISSEDELPGFIAKVAEYKEVEKMLLKRCHGLEPDKNEELEADRFNSTKATYKPLPESDAPFVGLSNAISLINRYCAKLPSDTFTRLTPLWQINPEGDRYVCSLRLPINSPVKKTIKSPPMVNPLLARRAAAFLTCVLLHKVQELDDTLQPIGKENFQATEEDWNVFTLDTIDEELTNDNVEPRPGTTKRRQYYYKRVADAFTDCYPVVGQKNYFYKIVMTLTCPLPEEQNTRGRKIYPPEESLQGFGILTAKEIPKVCCFPIFTRSGEVNVELKLCASNIVIDTSQVEKISEFLNYTFTSVLRLQKYLMLFNPSESDNSYLIVPTIEENGLTIIDWSFIDIIYKKRSIRPETLPESARVSYVFDPAKYRDAVVMPWYRNQDQPQYFYVAEICSNLNPSSAFPGSEYATFEEYYLRKYKIRIQNKEQHLLDVDHTSARLNFLTPRYVNRKGVALPTSSEETKRAKRENLEQKQILVPELCAVHPFPASLWRKAVCLPCILYRINALLLADQIRRTVAKDIGLGKMDLGDDFRWPALNFGWSLSDVLKKPKCDQQKIEQLTINEISITDTVETMKMDANLENEVKAIEDGEEPKNFLEIGMWSNEMFTASSSDDGFVRYGSPTSWMNVQNDMEEFSDTDSSVSLSEVSELECGRLKIEFTGDNVAEAFDDDMDFDEEFHLHSTAYNWGIEDNSAYSEELKKTFLQNCEKNKQDFCGLGMVIAKDEKFCKMQFQDDEVSALSQFSYNSDCIDKLMKYVDEISFETKPNDLHAGTIRTTSPPVEDQFSFDAQPDLSIHPGPSPSVILQALTMSNANDGINLERLETIGDSFLKYAITNYLYLKYENIHEGKLSHLRSKQVSNLNLYRLGKRKLLGECMIATKFDPHDNWLPPCYYVPKELEEALIDARVPAHCWTEADVAATRDMTLDQICQMVREKGETLEIPSIIPYNLVTQHSIPDKSIADCVEALIGAYLIECGPRGALLFMAWLGIRVLPQLPDGSYGELACPGSPLLHNVPNAEEELEALLDGYDKFEDNIGYHFRDKAYLLQALTHASYSPNTLTDCYQRLEFLGDAVLDYLITRHLYEDSRMHSPGALTDLRSALVNNTIFASLAVRHGFHRYFRHLSPGLHEVIERFIRLQEESGHMLVEELYLLGEHECEEVEDVEVPKALGDVFESVAGAIFLDSGMSLDAVWKVYYRIMHKEIEQFSNRVPKSPIRELLEMEPETAKFGKPEKLADGRRVRVTVEVFGKGVFKGIGRNYRIAKCTAAKCALKYLKRKGMLKKSQ